MIAVTLDNPRHYKLANDNGADLIEIRTDLYPKVNIPRLIAKCTKPVILTIKSPQTILLDYIDLPNVKYVDIDYRLKGLIKDFHTMRPKHVKLIVSFHDYKETPTWHELKDRLVQLRKLKPDVLKIATTIEHIDDVYCIMRLQKLLGKSGIVIGMGELGIMTRVYNKSLLTFACLHADKPVAPGQLTVQQIQTTKIFGLVGSHISHSVSPLIHTTAFLTHRLPYRYQLWETDNLKNFMEVFAFFGLPGASVTMPFKDHVMRYIDGVDIHAKKIGAVNTIVRKGKKLIGYNTDWLGVQAALHGELKNKKVMILGAGGAAAAVYYAAKKAGASEIAMLTRQEMPTDEDDFDILINATPIYDMMLVPEDSLYSKVVMDCNYGPKTQLLRTAEPIAYKTLDGLPMLVYQAAEQYRLWIGKTMPIKKILTILQVTI